MSRTMKAFKRQVKLGVVASALLACVVACSRTTLTCAEGNTSDACRVPAADTTGSIRPQGTATRETSGGAPPIIAPPATVLSAPPAPRPRLATVHRRAAPSRAARALPAPAVCDVTGSVSSRSAASATRLDAHWELDDRNSVEVRAGDTLESLAQRHRIPDSVMREANGLGPDALQPGQRIVIPRYHPYPPKTVSRPVAAVSAARRRYAVEHTVAPGETLSTIARRYAGSVAAIARFNGITDAARIRFGDVILIPPG